MHLLDITLTLVNKHQLRGYVSNPGSDCLRLYTSCDHPTRHLKGKPKTTVFPRSKGRSKHIALVSIARDIGLPHPPHLARLTCPKLSPVPNMPKRVPGTDVGQRTRSSTQLLKPSFALMTAAGNARTWSSAPATAMQELSCGLHSIDVIGALWCCATIRHTATDGRLVIMGAAHIAI